LPDGETDRAGFGWTGGERAVTEPRSVYLERLSWKEIREAIDAGFDTVLVPGGSVEQHGPHLGILKDAAWAEAIGAEIAHELGETLVAPVIRPGTSDHHMGFAGTISYRPETLMAVVEDYCHSLESHGFDTIVLFSMHGGNFPAMNAVLPRIATEIDAEIITLLDRELLIDPLLESLDALGVPREARGHGGAAVTASVLHLRPEFVLEEEYRPGYRGEVSTSTLTTHGLDAVSEMGHMGDPTRATEELGREVTGQLVDAFVDRIQTERGNRHE